MRALVKAIAGILLLLFACFCFSRFHTQYALTEVKYGDPADPADTNGVAVSATNPLVAASTNAIGSITQESTNAVAATNASESISSANAVAAPRSRAAVKNDSSNAFAWMGGFVASLLALGLLGAWTVAQWFAGRAHSAVFATDAPPTNDPEYDAAEAEWTNGNYLPAIEMMREYLKRFPSEQFVAIRIAEIYEKDLNNYPAAALELEEVLNKKIGREKWGWTAIHLANIYSGRLGQPDKALEVLRRIVKEAPNTAAAKKAWERLGPDPAAEGAANAEAETPQNMPKGFAPKKKP
jgi:TolA-binding protein